MKLLGGLMVLLACGVLGARGSLLEFRKMIKELTGKSAFPHYTMYGCYCGLGGRGQPRDATDSCCFAHDCCYEKLCKCRTKTDRYRFSIRGGVVTCGKGTWCERQICACDKAAVACFRGSLGSYNAKYPLLLRQTLHRTITEVLSRAPA